MGDHRPHEGEALALQDVRPDERRARVVPNAVITQRMGYVLMWPAGLGAGALVLVLGVGLLVVVRRRQREVRHLSVAFDWEVRRELQERLKQIASSGSMNSEEGLYRAAAQTRDSLLERMAAARYAFASTALPKKDEAESRFRSVVTDLRTRYRSEVFDGSEQREGPEVRARAEEGRGLVVVSMVVAVDGRLTPLPKRVDRGSVTPILRRLLPGSAKSLLAMEVVWSPAAEEDRMSSAELEALYPELLRLDDGADLGRVRCRQCATPYAGELERCPSCGAPREAD